MPDHRALEPSPAEVRFVMAGVELRAGSLGAARALLDQSLRERSSVQAWGLYGSILRQAGDSNGVLDAVQKALGSPDAPQSPVARADAHLLAMQVERAAGAQDRARTHLAAALKDGLDARARATTAPARALAERVLAQVAYFYGDRDAVARAIHRSFDAAGVDKLVAGSVAVEATSTALLLGDVKSGREWLRRATELGVEDEDLVYCALWIQLLEQTLKTPREPLTTKTLQTIKPGLSWPSQLAAWGQGKIDDAHLQARARSVSEHADADFYVTMRKRAAGDPSAAAQLALVSRSPAVQLVETHIAQELTLLGSSRFLGPPPSPLP